MSCKTLWKLWCGFWDRFVKNKKLFWVYWGVRVSSYLRVWLPPLTVPALSPCRL